MAGKLRIGLIGAGGIGAIRAQALQRSSTCRLTAVCDVDPLKTNPWQSSCATFDSTTALLNSDSCDAVVVCTPPHLHCDLSIEAMRAEKHVLVEKPMAPSLEACELMVKVARETNRVLTVGYNHRYFKGVDIVRNAIISREIGQLHFIRAFTGHMGLKEFQAPWMYSKDVMGGGTLFDNGTHLLDLVANLMPPIVRVDARTENRLWDLDVEDNAHLRLESADGVYCDLHASWTEWKGYRFYIEAYGDRGLAQMYYAPMFARVITMAHDRKSSHAQKHFFFKDILKEKVRGWQTTVVDTFLQEFDDFNSLVAGLTPKGPIAVGADGLHAVRLATLAYQSSKESHPMVV